MKLQGLFDNFLFLKPNWFKYPDDLNPELLKRFDQFVSLIGVKPIVLSDYRPDDLKQHGKGNAIDVTFPGVDSLKIYETARRNFLFSGIGVYINEKGIVSFHFDVRTDRTVENPALWGDLVTHPYDPDLNRNIRVDNYTTIDAVLDVIKKKEVLGLSLLLLFAGVMIFILKTK